MVGLFGTRSETHKRPDLLDIQPDPDRIIRATSPQQEVHPSRGRRKEKKGKGKSRRKKKDAQHLGGRSRDIAVIRPLFLLGPIFLCCPVPSRLIVLLSFLTSRLLYKGKRKKRKSPAVPISEPYRAVLLLLALVHCQCISMCLVVCVPSRDGWAYNTPLSLPTRLATPTPYAIIAIILCPQDEIFSLTRSAEIEAPLPIGTQTKQINARKMTG